MPAQSSQRDPPLAVSAESSLSLEEIDQLGGESLANFAHFVPFSSRDTRLSWVKVTREGQLVAAVPVVRLVKRMATDMLRRPWKTWLRYLFGPLAKKTTLLVDTSFLGYDYVSPFFCLPGTDATAVKQHVFRFLRSQPKVDTVWIAEPAAQAEWARSEPFLCFQILPMVQIDVAGCQRMDDYLGTISKKRRRNYRTHREQFASRGATISVHHNPLKPELARGVYECLRRSAARSALYVPYNDVWTHEEAVRTQPQTVFVAELADEVVGFMSFLECSDRMLQCHGGLDYGVSQDLQAYHNLIYSAIEYAISRGYHRLSMGPLNNETKRRAGTRQQPVVACLWNRYPLDRLMARQLFHTRFEVYCGPLEDAAGSPGGATPTT